MYNVLTSFNEKYWLEIAKENIDLLDHNWIQNSNISLYHQLPKIDQSFSNRVQWYDLYESCPELVEFSEKWKDHPKANGTFKTKQNMAFRWNAIKFCHKTFAIWHQAKTQNNGWLIWLDCDVVTLKTINEEFLRKICPETHAISYMGRPGKYSECGFIGFNLSKKEAKDFLLEWENLYMSGDFIDCKETHDSWTFDYLRLQKPKDLFFNVNSSAVTDKNPFSQSMLGNYMAHAKGDKKQKQTKRLKSRLS